MAEGNVMHALLQNKAKNLYTCVTTITHMILSMKSIRIAALLLFISTGAFAQFFQLGIRGGVNSYNVRYDAITVNNISIESASKNGLHLGFYSRIQVLGFYVQPELLYTRMGSSITTSTNGNASTADLTFQRIDIPVLAGKKFFGLLRVNGGPVFSNLLKADLNENNLSQNITDTYRNNTVGFQVGLGLDFWKLVVDAKYEGSLMRFGNSISTNGQTFNTDARPSQWLLSVGYRVF